MTITFKIRIADLLAELLTDADIFRRALDAAGAVTAVFLHHTLQAFNKFTVAVEFYIRWQFHKNILSAAAAHPARLS
jgi:hypothetical protein